MSDDVQEFLDGCKQLMNRSTLDLTQAVYQMVCVLAVRTPDEKDPTLILRKMGAQQGLRMAPEFRLVLTEMQAEIDYP